MTSRPDLTPRQARALAFITEHTTGQGYPPALRELGAAIGLVSPSSVQHVLEQLAAKGYVSRVPGKPRAIRVNGTEGGDAA